MTISPRRASTVNWPQMDTDKNRFKHKEITEKIIGVFYEVYNELGHGFLESVYEKSLEVALNSMGLRVCRQIEIPVSFRGQRVGIFTADMLVEDSVLLELKAARALDSGAPGTTSELFARD